MAQEKANPENPVPTLPPRAGGPLPFASNRCRTEDIPRDVGWLLLTAGMIGEIAPGVVGTPFWIIGTMILWPRMGRRMESWLESRAPQIFNNGMRQAWRFLDDLERRYPSCGNQQE